MKIHRRQTDKYFYWKKREGAEQGRSTLTESDQLIQMHDKNMMNKTIVEKMEVMKEHQQDWTDDLTNKERNPYQGGIYEHNKVKKKTQSAGQEENSTHNTGGKLA